MSDLKKMNADSGAAAGTTGTAVRMSAKSIAFIGMLGALSMILIVLNFPIPLTPSFMKFDLAELPALFAGFFMGPAAGAAVVVVRLVLKLVIQGTSTAFVGEFSNLVGSLVFVLIAAFIYKHHKTKKTAILSMVIATVVVSVAYVILNAFVMFPLYSRLYGMPMEAIIGMGAAVNPLVKDELTMMLFSVFPFNLFKHAVTALITFLLYKRVGKVLRGILAK